MAFLMSAPPPKPRFSEMLTRLLLEYGYFDPWTHTLEYEKYGMKVKLQVWDDDWKKKQEK